MLLCAVIFGVKCVFFGFLISVGVDLVVCWFCIMVAGIGCFGLWLFVILRIRCSLNLLV